jgi:hypothetical protein
MADAIAPGDLGQVLASIGGFEDVVKDMSASAGSRWVEGLTSAADTEMP